MGSNLGIYTINASRPPASSRSSIAQHSTEAIRIAIIMLLALFASNAALAADKDCAHATTQADISRCTNASASAEQKKLDALLAELKQSLSPMNWKILEQSQASWEKSRKLDCRIEASFFDGGSIQSTIVNGCYDQHTSDRIDRLRLPVSELCNDR